MQYEPYCQTVGYIVRPKQYDKEHQLDQSYQFGVLSRQAIGVLDQSLELVVLGESDDLQHSAKLRENLERRAARLGVTFSLKLDCYKKYANEFPLFIFQPYHYFKTCIFCLCSTTRFAMQFAENVINVSRRETFLNNIMMRRGKKGQMQQQ